MNMNMLLLTIFFLIFITSSSQKQEDDPITGFDFPSFSLRNLSLLGDSYLRNGMIGLTREVGVPTSSSGSVMYKFPIPFASFSTRFCFSITNLNPTGTSFGDGFTFFISPDNHTLGSPGAFLGLANSTNSTTPRFLAVEFDTRLDLRFNDPNDHHVGVDVDSLNSIDTADPTLQGIDLKSGNSITAWIDYKADKKRLRLFLSYSSFKPPEPILMLNLDLSDYFKEQQPMYVGFSASTEGSTELHWIQSWTFQMFDSMSLGQRLNPHNVSDHSLIFKPPPIPISDPSNPSNRHHRRLALGLGISGPIFFFALLLVFGYVAVKKWKGLKSLKSFKAEISTGPREFSYKELKWATRGFHATRIIGHGAFGTVYKAFFVSSGNISAVKRSKHTHEGKAEFLAELSIIACLRHKNLVQLQGWCVEKGELLLVYEFMPNGSLDNVLYQESAENATSLKWCHRYNIVIGMASVLTYLHQECEQQVIHRDIKTSNILLDGNLNARLGDFGLARLMDHDKSPVSTLTAGTMGYLAPEYLQYGKATDKTDVFSYGVVILEVACGRRPIERESNSSQKMVNLVDWVWGLYAQGRIIEAGDKRLNGEFKDEDMIKLLLVGLSCANPDAMERPTMRRVLQILNEEAEPLLVPKRKPFLTFSCGGVALSVDDIVSDGETD